MTNVEDKIIARAAREGASEREVADRYEAEYWLQLDRLGVRAPDEVPRATEFIDQMVQLIAELVERGHAYVIEGEGVYFQVDSYPGYGELSHRKLEDLLDNAGAGRRRRAEAQPGRLRAVEGGEAGRARLGVAVGPGPARVGTSSARRCRSRSSARASTSTAAATTSCSRTTRTKRAQAEAAGHAVRAALDPQRHGRGRRREDVEVAGQLHHAGGLPSTRTAHARSASRCCRSTTARAPSSDPPRCRPRAKAVERLDALVRRAGGALIDFSTAPYDEETVATFRAAMDDDFGTPAAVATIFDAVKRANVAIDRGDHYTAASLVATVRHLGEALGLEIGAAAADRDDTADSEEIDALVAARNVARADRDFAEADRIRDELARAASRSRTLRPARSGIDDGAKRPARKPSRREPGRRDESRRDGPRDGRGESGLGGDQVEGRNAVRELLRARQRRVSELWIVPAREAPVIDEILELATEVGARIRRVSPEQLDERARTDAPQGVLALAAPIKNHDIDELLSRPDAFLLAWTASPIRATSAPCCASPRRRA